MSSNTKEIFYNWQRFLKENNNFNSKIILIENSTNPDVNVKFEDIKTLIEWGDKLEFLINENVSMRLLENHYLNEGVFSAFKKAKDKVKSFFFQGWTQDKIDDEGNIIKSDLTSEESSAVQEYTSKTKLVMSVLLAAKLTSIILGSLALGSLDSSDNSTIVDVTTSAVQQTSGLDDITSRDVETATEIPTQKFVFDQMQIKGKLPVQKIDFKPLMINVQKEVAKIVSEETGKSESNIIDQIQNDPEVKRRFQELIQSNEFVAGALRGEAFAHGVDVDDPRGFDFAKQTSSQTRDLKIANEYVKQLIKSTSFNNLKANSQEINDSLKNFNSKTLQKKMKDLGKNYSEKLISAARIYTLKMLAKDNPDIFSKSQESKLNTKISVFAGGGNSPDSKNSSGSTYDVSGSKEAKILVAIYSSLNNFTQDFEGFDNTNVKQIEKELKDSIKSFGLNPNSGVGEKAVYNFITFIISNATSTDSIDLLKSTLDNQDNFSKNVEQTTSALTTFHMKGSVNSLSTAKSKVNR